MLHRQRSTQSVCSEEQRIIRKVALIQAHRSAPTRGSWRINKILADRSHADLGAIVIGRSAPVSIEFLRVEVRPKPLPFLIQRVDRTIAPRELRIMDRPNRRATDQRVSVGASGAALTHPSKSCAMFMRARVARPKSHLSGSIFSGSFLSVVKKKWGGI